MVFGLISSTTLVSLHGTIEKPLNVTVSDI